MLFVISAPSGAGKTTIINEVKKQLPDIKFSVSATTRDKREKEIDGKDYYFILDDEFKSKINNNDFVEWEEVFGNYYGTLKSELEQCLGDSCDMLFDVDVNGALNIKKLYPQAVTIFIYAPVEQIVHRLKNRGTESEEQVNKRIDRMKMEMELKDKFDYEVDNETKEGNCLEKSVNKVIEIIKHIKEK